VAGRERLLNSEDEGTGSADDEADMATGLNSLAEAAAAVQAAQPGATRYPKRTRTTSRALADGVNLEDYFEQDSDDDQLRLAQVLGESTAAAGAAAAAAATGAAAAAAQEAAAGTAHGTQTKGRKRKGCLTGHNVVLSSLR
jgi:hypothetical protein